MKADTLLSPGLLSNGQTLRHQVAHAISNVEVVCGLPGNRSSALALSAFLTDAASKLATLVAEGLVTTAQSTALAVPDTGTLNVTDSVFTFTFENAVGNPVAGLDVTVVRTGTSTGGTLSALTGVTNALGQFVVTVDGVGTTAGTLILTATVANPGALADAVVTDTLTYS
jgi:hypothetical protein